MFWFTMSAEPPFRLLRLSREFCFRAMGPFRGAVVSGDASNVSRAATVDGDDLHEWERDCESVQFASSLVRDPETGELLVGYGAQDAHPLVVALPATAALEMLVLLE